MVGFSQISIFCSFQDIVLPLPLIKKSYHQILQKNPTDYRTLLLILLLPHRHNLYLHEIDKKKVLPWFQVFKNGCRFDKDRLPIFKKTVNIPFWYWKGNADNFCHINQR